MSNAQSGLLLRYVRNLAEPAANLSDKELLACFVAIKDEGSFVQLVRRHGPMAYHTAKRILGNVQDAEDVFQATFLTLACKAEHLNWRESIGPWIHEVASRLALESKARSACRRRHEAN